MPPNSDLYELKATPGAEARASCGCVFMYALRRMIDARSGSWFTSHDLVVVPCSEAHTEIARGVAQPVEGEVATERLLSDLVAEMENRIRV